MNINELYSIYLACDCRVTTDSRSIAGGELFFALKGENFDGNDYALSALERGAAYAVVDRPELQGERVINVEDSFKAMQELAIHHRRNVSAGRLIVLGLTGTNGKTTTKNLLQAVLSKKLRVCATSGNLNNDIGVPLTLLSIRPNTELAIVEMGASHPDDIAKLVRVCEPDYGLITNVGKAHLQGFGSFEGVKSAKGELYQWLGKREGSRIFINEDDIDLKQMSDGIPSHFYGYGLEYQSAKILPTSPQQPYLRLQLSGRTISTKLIGSYNANNVLAALCVAQFCGIPSEDAIAAIEAYTPANKRSQLILKDGNTIILDAYNANPSSMAAALDGFLASDYKSKLALLGDMKELGEDSAQEHIAVVERLRDADVQVFLVGEEFAKAVQTLGVDMICFKTSALLREYLQAHKPVDSLILIKGSRSTQMEKVLE